MHIAVLIISAAITILLLFVLFGSRKRQTPQSAVRSDSSKQRSSGGKPCPLCGEPLESGEKVHSVLYPGKPDSLMEIYGCPHCEHENSPNRRYCPVCKKEMPHGSVLIARVFEKPGKNHVHVLGCSGCYGGRSRVPKK